MIDLTPEAKDILHEWLAKHPKYAHIQWPEFTVQWSNRLRTAAGTIKYNNMVISLSTNYYIKFGLARSRKTLRHEMAHYISYVVFKEKSHGDIFKKVCHELGGSMNRKMAGDTYKESASQDYIQTEPRIQYTCPCGAVYQRKNRINKNRMHLYRCQRCKTSMSRFTVTEV